MTRRLLKADGSPPVPPASGRAWGVPIPADALDEPPDPPAKPVRILRQTAVEGRAVPLGPAWDAGPGAPEESAEPEPTQEEQFAARLAEAEAAARAEGLAEGRAQAEAEAAARTQALATRLDAELDALAETVRAFQDRLQRGLVDVALEAGEILAGGPLPESFRGAALRAVAQAVEAVSEGDRITLQVHPVDLLRLEEGGLVEAVSEVYPDLRWTTNSELEEGDWIAASAESAVRRVRAELLDGLRARLDLLTAAHDAPAAPEAGTPPSTPPAFAPLSESGLLDDTDLPAFEATAAPPPPASGSAPANPNA